MRFLVRASIPNEAGNELVADPEFGKTMEQIMGDIRPEAVYFTAEGGQRTIYMVVNIEEASQLPAIAEPLWLGLEAEVDALPVMDQADFEKAGPAIAEAVRKYAR